MEGDITQVPVAQEVQPEIKDASQTLTGRIKRFVKNTRVNSKNTKVDKIVKG